jgi:hypothetical protein
VAAEGVHDAAVAESAPAGFDAPAPAGEAESAEVIAEPMELEGETGARWEATIEMPAAAARELRDDVTTPEDAGRGEEPGQPDEPASGPDHEAVLQQHEAPADEEEGEEESPSEMPSAVVEQKRGGPPRRGWWSRFARKDD